MLCRRAALERVGGFRPEYFLYFEDFDLSLRLRKVARLAYLPQVGILHRGARCPQGLAPHPAVRPGGGDVFQPARMAVVAVNTEGTFPLLDAAVRAGVERFVYLSSVKAAGDPGPQCVDETWDAPPDTPYGQAKRAALEKLLGWACYDSTRIERELGYRPDWTFQRYCELGLQGL